MKKNTKKSTSKEKQELPDGRIAIYFKLEPEVWDKLDKLRKQEVLDTVTQLCRITCVKLANTVKQY